MKIQSSLNHFLGIHDDHTVFHLDWENKIATFINGKPYGAKWRKEFVSGNIRYLTSTLQTAKNIPEIKDIYPKSMIPLLKSHLQKCTRRGYAVKAVKTAKHLINLDLHVFLRRWTIIILEDSMINFNYTVLVWIMVAVSKGFIPSPEVLDWILGTVHATANYPFKLEFYEYPQRDNPSLDLDILKALKIRKEYGGMKGDAIMIENIIKTLIDQRDSKGNLPLKISENMSFPVHSIDYNSVHALKLEEWELAAVDFHVSDIIEKWYQNLSDSDQKKWTRDDLVSCMWECSGSINHRDPGQKISWNLWTKYADQICKIAKSILRYKFSSGMTKENRKEDVDQRNVKRVRVNFEAVNKNN